MTTFSSSGCRQGEGRVRGGKEMGGGGGGGGEKEGGRILALLLPR
jgi:hypothetical protein